MEESATEAIAFFIYAFVSIFIIVNPVGGLITFISLTSGMSATERKEIAKRSVTVACLLAIVFAISYLIFRFADIINRILGVSGSLVVTRVMGLLLGAIAVNFISVGIWNIYISMI